jgi:hypothetical protein
MLPLLSMRLFSEEKKMGTEELLFTSPLSVGQIILGKYLASLIVLFFMLFLSAIPTLFTFIYGNPEPLPYLLGYLGLFLLGQHSWGWAFSGPQSLKIRLSRLF